MIVAVGGIKGGSGKTTVATNLTIMRATQGRDVLLIDADDQETAADFSVLRNDQLPNGAGYTVTRLIGPAVRTETIRFSEKYDDIVIDIGGRDTISQRAAVLVADIFLVPFVPRSFDVWTLEKVSKIVEEVRMLNPSLQAYAFLNRADPRGSYNKDAAEYICRTTVLKFIDAKLGTRNAFANAASQGLSVTELGSPDLKAIEEIGSLYRQVFGFQAGGC